MSAKKAAKKSTGKAPGRKRVTTNKNGITHGTGEDVGDVDADRVITTAIGKNTDVEIRGNFLYIDGKLVGSKGQVKAAVNRMFRRARRGEE